MIKDAKEINHRLNILWQFIKAHDIPSQADIEAWGEIVADTEKLKTMTDGKDPLNVLFRRWLVSYLEYMNIISKGMPTLSQELKEVLKEGV